MFDRNHGMNRKYAIAAAGITLCYLMAPMVSGALNASSVSGPAIYPEALHACLFSKAFELCRGTLPKDSPTALLYYRELFYGFPRRPKPREVRDNIVRVIESRVRTQSLYLQMLQEENARLNEAPK